MADTWATENGKEKLWWAENPVTKRIFFTSPMSPLPAGYVRKSTTNPREMDRLFNRMHEQEREQNEKFIEKLYHRGRESYDAVRNRLKARMAEAGVSDAEKNIIRASLKLMDDKDSRMQENHAFGVSAMQEQEAPIEGARTTIMVEDRKVN